MAGDFDFGDDVEDVEDDYDVDIKEAFGLPDSLPPIRLPSLPELAALAREAPLVGQLHALAVWYGDGREATDDGMPTDSDLLAAARALGVSETDLVFLWEYALGVEWLTLAEDDEERVIVIPGELADAWTDGDDRAMFDLWSSTLAAVLEETLLVSGPAAAEDWDELFGELSFTGQPMALAVLLFLARREGLSLTDFTEVLWENASGDMAAAQAAKVRARWRKMYGDPARLLLDKLAELRAVSEADDMIRLTPLAQAALHEQLVDAGVEIPLLPPTAAELTGAELLAMAEGVADEEFEAESDAWIAARGAGPGARELLALAAAGDPGERMLAVAAVTRIGPAAEQAWRECLDVPQVRAYAKVALAALAGGQERERPADLEPLPDDVAWLTTDMLALACDDEFPDPDEIVASFREAIPEGQEAAVFDLMWHGSHPDALDVLHHVGRYHPDKRIAKAARTAEYRAVSYRASRQ